MSKQRPVIAVLVGSLRKDSFNKQLAHALEKVAGDRAEFRRIRIDDQPLYNQDFDGDYPPVCKRLKSIALVKTDPAKQSRPALWRASIACLSLKTCSYARARQRLALWFARLFSTAAMKPGTFNVRA